MGDPWTLVKAGTIGGEATPRRPQAKWLDRLERRNGDRDDLIGHLEEADVEQGGRVSSKLEFRLQSSHSREDVVGRNRARSNSGGFSRLPASRRRRDVYKKGRLRHASPRE